MSCVQDKVNPKKVTPAKYTGNNVASFNGSQIIELSADVIPTGFPFTLSGWFKTSGSASLGGILSLSDSSSATEYYAVYLETDGTIKGLRRSGASFLRIGSSTPGEYDNAEWHHVEFKILSESSAELWADGNFIASDTNNLPFISTLDKATIGGIQDSSPSYYTGLVQIAGINGSLYPLSEGVNLPYDVSGNGNHATSMTATWATDDDAQPWNIEKGFTDWGQDAQPELLTNIQTTLDTLQEIKDLGTGHIEAVVIGDSWSQSSPYWLKQFADETKAIYGNGGTGYGSFGGFMNGNISGFASDTDGTITLGGSWTTLNGGRNSLDTTAISSSSAGNTINIAYSGGGVSKYLHYRQQPGGGDVRWRLNGGTWTTLSTDGAEDYIEFLFGFGTVSTIEIETLDSDPVELFGVLLRTANVGIVYHKVARSGGRAENFNNISDLDAWKFLLNKLGAPPDLFIVAFGTNEQILERTPASYKSELKELIQRFREVNASSDVIVWCPAKNVNEATATYKMSEYASVAREVAVEESCAFVSSINWFGDSYDDYSFTSNRPLLGSDGVHPDTTNGSEVVTQMMLSVYGDEDVITPVSVPHNSDGEVVDEVLILPAIYKVIGEHIGGYPHNGAESKVQHTDPDYAIFGGASFWGNGVDTWDEEAYTAMYNHPNGANNLWIKWVEIDGVYHAEEFIQYNVNQEFTASEVSKNEKYCGSTPAGGFSALRDVDGELVTDVDGNVIFTS